ncbi:MAG: hypothetical protein HDQ88_06255 [Clostridia bacterium]|nr:hypothetical protein [Clostridia bacterium]
MAQKKGKLSKRALISIISAVLALLLAVALIVTNIFIPVKYLSAYFVLKDENVAGQMRVTFIDVGNSDCTIIELPDGKIMLVDGGNGTHANTVKALKELNRRGIDKIDYLICTSVADETCAGLTEILKYKKAEIVYAPYCTTPYVSEGYRKFSEELKRQNKDFTVAEYGKGVVNPEYGYSFLFLSPSVHSNPQGEYESLNKDPTPKNIRNASAVIWLEYAGVGILLLGNAGKEVQERLVNAYSDDIGLDTVDITNCSIIRVADHGSDDGTFAPLYDLIKPETAIISVGENGRNCPALSAVSDAYAYVKDKLYRTDEDGTVTVTVNKGTYEVLKEKV